GVNAVPLFRTGRLRMSAPWRRRRSGVATNNGLGRWSVVSIGSLSSFPGVAFRLSICRAAGTECVSPGCPGSRRRPAVEIKLSEGGIVASAGAAGGEADDELGAPAGAVAVGRDGAAVQLDQAPHQGQADAQPASRRPLVEQVEDPRQ